MIGVYEIINTKTGICYIGSSKQINKRISAHFSKLRLNKHTNSYLQATYNKYGKDNFKINILEICDLENIKEVEQKYLDSKCKAQEYIDGKNKKFRKLCYNFLPEAYAAKGFNIINPSERKNTRIIYVYDIYGRFYKKFNSLINCAQFFEVTSSSISKVLKNKRKKILLSKSRMCKYDFNYTKDVKINLLKLNNKKDKFKVYTCFNEFIGYSNLEELSSKLNCSKNSVYSAISKNRPLRGYILKYTSKDIV